LILPLFGPTPAILSIAGLEPVHHQDLLLHHWLATSGISPTQALWPPSFDLLHNVFPPPPYYSLPHCPLFDFQVRIADYPWDWSLDEITHEHFLMCAWFLFWCIKKQGPCVSPSRSAGCVVL
jgi:hypothetical protein